MADLDATLEAHFEAPSAEFSPRQRTLIRASLYLWHDHLDAAHEIVQDLPSADGSLLHAIIHRREPDYPNARYWLQRAGSHPSFARLAAEARQAIATAAQPTLLARLLPHGAWDPGAFVDAVRAARAQSQTTASPLLEILEALQELEMCSFLHHLFDR